MPIYEYACIGCKYKFEELQDITDDPFEICPKCGESLKRLVSKTFSQVMNSPKEQMEKIKEETRKDVEAIRNGDIEKAADYLGEKGALDYYGEK